MPQVINARIASNGRMVLPKAAREALGVTGAGVIALTVDGDEVKLTTMASRIKYAQELYRKHAKGDYSVDDFLRERREEAAQDESKGL
jgi:bifunctional DNA-binding transcriptional regulator/antitoxin component of YhaV-PrlF toxin-antitoxin module